MSKRGGNIVFSIILLCFSHAVQAGERPEENISDSKYFKAFLNAGNIHPGQLNLDRSIGIYQDLVADLRSKRNKNSFLESVFHKVHRRLLKSYSNYPEFSEIFESGSYDCLTATALYVLILDDLDVDYRIVETKFHIYLKVSHNGMEALYETLIQ